MVVQSTSPMFARQSYWCIVESVKQAGLRVYPYHVYVPSFGEWGYVIGSFAPYEPPRAIAVRAAIPFDRQRRASCSYFRWTCSRCRPSRID